jgi:uncharacterized RDD family membrane protein YckC
MSSLDRQLIIDTPEQVSLEFHLAGIGSRFMAFLVDTLIEVVIFVVLGIAFALTRLTFRGAPSNWATALLIIGFFVVYWGYFALFEALMQGQTPGKRVVGIRVVKDSGRGIKPGESLTRNFMRAIDQLPGFYLFALICMLVSKEKKRIGDYVAGTVVVHEKSSQEVYPDLQELDATVPVQDWALKLNNKDLELIESFLHRRIALEPSSRTATAIRIVQHIQSKTNEAPAPGELYEDFLQRIAIAIRNSRRV